MKHETIETVLKGQNTKVTAKDLLLKVAPSFKESERLIKTLQLCNSSTETQGSHAQPGLHVSDGEPEDLFIPVTFGHIPVKCVPFTIIQEAAEKLGELANEASITDILTDARYLAMIRVRSTMLGKSGIRDHLVKLKMAAADEGVDAAHALEALHYFEDHWRDARTVQDLLHELARGMTKAYTSLRMAQAETEAPSSELTLDLLTQQYCAENPHGPFGRSLYERCFQDTWTMYVLYSFAFTVFDKLALAHDEVCRAQAQIHLGNQSHCPAGARIQASCLSHEIEYCYSSQKDLSPELDEMARCCCAADEVEIIHDSFGMKKKRYATAGCMASRMEYFSE